MASEKSIATTSDVKVMIKPDKINCWNITNYIKFYHIISMSSFFIRAHLPFSNRTTFCVVLFCLLFHLLFVFVFLVSCLRNIERNMTLLEICHMLGNSSDVIIWETKSTLTFASLLTCGFVSMLVVTLDKCLGGTGLNRVKVFIYSGFLFYNHSFAYKKWFISFVCKTFL